MEGLQTELGDGLTKVRTETNGKLKAKMDKKDLGHFLVKKVDTDAFKSQVGVLSESLLGLKQKVGALHSQLSDLPKSPPISETKIV